MVSTFRRAVGSEVFTLEGGKLAQQANGSILLRFGENVVLVTATMSKPREGIDFFPLTIEFEERLYARGKIPGSFFRREGRPSTHGVLIARLTDRPTRPLFPKGFKNEIQVVITPLSTDQKTPIDVLAVIGASTALSISDIPWEGPISATRIGYLNGEFVINPTYDQLDESDLDLIVAGSRDGVIMMEAAANEVPEHVVLEAIERAQNANQQVIDLQEEAVRALGKPKVGFDSDSYPPELEGRLSASLGGGLASALSSSNGNAEQAERIKSLKSGLVERMGEEFQHGHISQAFEALLDRELRARMLSSNVRPDGRAPREIRPISCEVALLPRTHGTGLFTRGETQVLAVATLGSTGDAQKLDTLSPEESKRFMLHYNFPPYSVGETRRMGGPGRREIGHGALAEKALAPVLPSEDEFPYTLRLVSEILSSNGSTSMGSVCASTLALMDAGVPIREPVAGISVGLITGDNGQYVTLTDIQGLEDHIGDMDFKVAGTRKGITAIQLDIKVKSIGSNVMRDALEQAKEARLFILDRITETISSARTELSPHAPRMIKISIPMEKIGAVIGPGGRVIRGIVEQTKATVDVQNDGTIIIGSSDAEASQKAVAMIEDLTREIKVGDIYTGKVVKIANFGAFVELLPGRDGLVHISELADYRVPSVEDVVSLGEEITVIVREIDSMGRVNLSRRALLEGGDGQDGDGQARPDSGPAPRQGEPSRGRPEGDRGGYRPQGARPVGPRGGGPRSGPGGPDRRRR